VDASTAETIDMGLKTIATTRKIGDSSQDALKWFSAKQEPWLLFFDNADDLQLNLNKFLPKCSHGNIVITSRNPGLRGYGQHCQVSDMNETEAVDLLLKCASQDPSSANEQITAKIVKVCDPFICLFHLTVPLQRPCHISLSQLFRLEHSSWRVGPLTHIWNFIWRIELDY
jgi:hypothetical protein